MSAAHTRTKGNKIIDALPPDERLRLLAVCESVELVSAEILCECGGQTRHVYFPTTTFIAMACAVDEGPSAAVSMIGSEGLLGASVQLGVTVTPTRAMVLASGHAWRAPVGRFSEVLAASSRLTRDMRHYLYVLIAQMGMSVACQRYHEISPRLARWLLMTQDRCGDEKFLVTHDTLASMVGVRRVGITTAAHQFREDGLITYSRGNVRVVDRKGLEAVACSCYLADLRVYRQQMTRSRRSKGCE